MDNSSELLISELPCNLTNMITNNPAYSRPDWSITVSRVTGSKSLRTHGKLSKIVIVEKVQTIYIYIYIVNIYTEQKYKRNTFVFAPIF